MEPVSMTATFVKRHTELLACLLVLLASASTVSGQGLSGSAHDFTSLGWSGGHACRPCHTLEEADSSIKPLWNHQEPDASGFSMYWSPTLDAEAAAVPTGASLMCLGCHDGVTAVDAFNGEPGKTRLAGNVVISKDLQDDHPISIVYDARLVSIDRGLRPAADPAVASLLRDGNTVQCTSCHEPHNRTGVRYMLRMENTGSALCLTCHKK
jgi:predicted CXXCH cytochrome family protein